MPKAGLVARGLQFTDAVLQHGVGEIGDAILDGVLQPLEFGVCLGRTYVGRQLASYGVRRARCGDRVRVTKLLKTLGLQQALFDVFSHQIAELFRRDGATWTAGNALAAFGATGSGDGRSCRCAASLLHRKQRRSRCR